MRLMCIRDSPYRTSYYNEDWGFCISHNNLEEIEILNGITNNGVYHIVIDSSLTDGHLTYGELYKPGKVKEEILLSSYICHPSMANDNLSGPALLSAIAKELSTEDTYYSYRFLFIPETIGAITWLSMNENKFDNIKGGLVATCIGDKGILQYKPSRQSNTMIDSAVKKVFDDANVPHKLREFAPLGSDERQYSSPNLDFDFCSLMRSKYAQYPEYHTSLDKLGSVVTEKGLKRSIKMYKILINLIEKEKFPKSNYVGEPFLSKRKIYPSLGGAVHPKKFRDLLNYLSFCDGKNPSEKIANSCKINLKEGNKILKILLKNKLVKI